MSSPLRSCEEDEGMVVNSEGGDFDEEEDDDGELLDENASDINSPAALRETATPAAPGTVPGKKTPKKKPVGQEQVGERAILKTLFRRVCLKENNNSGPGLKI